MCSVQRMPQLTAENPAYHRSRHISSRPPASRLCMAPAVLSWLLYSPYNCLPHPRCRRSQICRSVGCVINLRREEETEWTFWSNTHAVMKWRLCYVLIRTSIKYRHICSTAHLMPNPFIVMVSYSDETPVLSLAVIFHPARAQGQIGAWLWAQSARGEWVGGTLVSLGRSWFLLMLFAWMCIPCFHTETPHWLTFNGNKIEKKEMGHVFLFLHANL